MTDDLTRDDEIAAALATLDVPEHGPAFWAELTDRLAAEAVPEEPVISLAQRRSLRWKRQSLRIATVAAAASVIAVAVGVGLGPDDGPLAPRPATAAEVAQRVTATLAQATTLRGTLAVRDRSGAGDRTQFVSTSRGDLHLETRTARGETSVSAYDAVRGVEEGYTLPAAGSDEPAFGGIRTGLAPMQTPDQGPLDWILRRNLSATLRAQQDMSDQPARETSFAGRPAWLLEAAAQPQDSAGDLAIDHIAATIDQGTLLPVRIVESRHGVTIREVTVTGLVVDEPAGRELFDLDFPAGVVPVRTEGDFRRVALRDVPAEVSYVPLVPARLPDGYELAEVAVADRTQSTGVEGLNPRSLEVVSLAYRRGFDRVLVTTRLRAVPGAVPLPGCRECLAGTPWSDPMASGEGIVDRPEPVTLTQGALAGVPAQLLISAQGTAPHLWALTETLVVTVSGDLTRTELLDVAGSLAATGG